MTNRVTFSSDGNIETQSMPSAGGVRSSTDYRGDGVAIRSGESGFRKEVSSSSDLADNDIVSVNGVELRADQARELGLLREIFDDAEQARPGQGEQPKVEGEADAPKSNTGHKEYDATVDRLNEHLESGAIQFEEATVYDTVNAQVAMSGLTVDDAVATVKGLENGSIADADVSGDLRSMLTQAEAEIERASTVAALHELGQAEFDGLAQMMQVHSGVRDVVERYAIDRMQGKHNGITWPELVEHLRDQIGA